MGGSGRQRFEPGGRLSTKQDTSLAKESEREQDKSNVIHIYSRPLTISAYENQPKCI